MAIVIDKRGASRMRARGLVPITFWADAPTVKAIDRAADVQMMPRAAFVKLCVMRLVTAKPDKKRKAKA